MAKPHIGFIGLGAMGAPMARRLLDAGFKVTSSVNKNRKAIEALLSQGIREVSSPAEVGAVADILMLVVWDEAQIDTILRHDNGALTSLKPGSKVLLMSTISPAYCRDLAAELKPKDIAIIDCPLSGMPKGAADGTLSLMAGGAAEDIAACQAPLEALGTVYHCGNVGAGQVMKLGNNAMFIGTLSILLEVRDAVVSQGVDFDSFLYVLNNSTGRSFVSQNIPVPEASVMPFSMPQKDISRLLMTGQEAKLTMPVLNACYRHTLEGS